MFVLTPLSDVRCACAVSIRLQVVRVDQDLEDFKRAVMNEIELDFSWYCRERSRSRREMEAWWLKRKDLVDALQDDPWPAWGTAEALERCRRFCNVGGGGNEDEGETSRRKSQVNVGQGEEEEDEERLRTNPEAKAEKSEPKISAARAKTQDEVGERARVGVADARPR